MKEQYSINELAMITSLTTRTLRNHLRQGTLTGEKVDGAWVFTPEDVDAFMALPAVRKSIQANHNAVVFDFLADNLKPQNRACVILDFAAGIAESAKISPLLLRTGESVLRHRAALPADPKRPAGDPLRRGGSGGGDPQELLQSPVV